MIAIAAIAVVGIAVGLLLAGGGQTGPLTGAIGPVKKATTLSMGMTVLGRGDGELSSEPPRKTQ